MVHMSAEAHCLLAHPCSHIIPITAPCALITASGMPGDLTAIIDDQRARAATEEHLMKGLYKVDRETLQVPPRTSPAGRGKIATYVNRCEDEAAAREASDRRPGEGRRIGLQTWVTRRVLPGVRDGSS